MGALDSCRHDLVIVRVDNVQCGAGLASGLVHRGEWPRSVSSCPMELGLSGAKRVVHSFAGRKGGWSWRDNGFF